MAKSLIKALKDKKPSPISNSHYIFIDGKGDIMSYFNDICFARFKANKIVKARLFINQHKREEYDDRKKKAELVKYFEWVIKESPWRFAFLNKKSKPSEYLKNGLSLDTNKSSVYLVGAMTAVREGWEYPQIPECFFFLQNKFGISKELSYVLAHFVDIAGRLRPITGGHSTIGSDTCSAFVRNFKECKLNAVLTKYPANKDATDYYGIHSLFNKNNLRDNLHTRLFGVTDKKGEGWNAYSFLDFDSEKVKNLLKELDNG